MFSCTADVSVRRHSVDRSSGGSSSIDGLAELDGPPTRDEPAECLPWTRRTGVCRYLPCPEMYVSTADEGGLGRTYDDLSHHWNSKVVQAASRFGRAQGDHSGQSKFKVHWDLLEP